MYEEREVINTTTGMRVEEPTTGQVHIYRYDVTTTCQNSIGMPEPKIDHSRYPLRTQPKAQT